MNIIFKYMLASFLFASGAANATAFFGPAAKCTLSNPALVPSQISIELYTVGLFSPSEKIQILYTFPDLNEETDVDLKFISELNSDDPESGVYKGEITNVSYLVEAELRLQTGELIVTDRGVEEVYSGACVPTLQ